MPLFFQSSFTAACGSNNSLADDLSLDRLLFLTASVNDATSLPTSLNLLTDPAVDWASES